MSLRVRHARDEGHDPVDTWAAHLGTDEHRRWANTASPLCLAQPDTLEGTQSYRSEPCRRDGRSMGEPDMMNTTTDLALPLSVPLAIRLHGDITERIARDRHKLAMLISLRAGLNAGPDLSEHLIATNIRDYENLLASLSQLLYGDS